MENQENIRVAKPSPEKPSVFGKVNDPNADANLKEMLTLKGTMKWRGKTPTGKVLPGGRKTRRLRRSKKTQRRRR